MIEIVLQSFIISQLHIIPKAKIGTHVAATETRSHGGEHMQHTVVLTTLTNWQTSLS